MGRTPGAYGFVVSCSLQGYVAPSDIVLSSMLVLTRNGGTTLTPLSSSWTYPGGRGPARLQTDMVRGRLDHAGLAAQL